MKALVKHELRNIWAVILYFVGCLGIGVWRVGASLQDSYETYMWSGYRMDLDTNLIRILTRESDIYILAIGIGLMLLIYLQFKDNKSIQVSSFIKSLPYTNEQICKVKLGCGILGFTVPFVLAYGSIMVLAIEAKSWLSVIEQVSPIGKELARLNSLGNVALYGVLVYSITILVYLFGFWMQYIINPNVASIVISGLVIVAVPFVVAITAGYAEIMVRADEGIRKVFNALYEVLYIPGYLQQGYHRGYEIWIGNRGNEYESIYNLVQIDGLGYKVLFIILLIGVCLLAIHICVKSYRAENQEGFVSHKWAENVFKIGVIISSMAAAVMLMTGLINIDFEMHKVSLHLVMIVAGAIGYFITNKICKIGQR